MTANPAFSVFLVILGASGAVRSQTVPPPPLPPGNSQVRVDAGMTEDERKRHVRAHHHKLHHKKDVSREADTSDATPREAAKTKPAQQRRAESTRSNR